MCLVVMHIYQQACLVAWLVSQLAWLLALSVMLVSEQMHSNQSYLLARMPHSRMKKSHEEEKNVTWCHITEMVPLHTPASSGHYHSWSEGCRQTVTCASLMRALGNGRFDRTGVCKVAFHLSTHVSKCLYIISAPSEE